MEVDDDCVLAKILVPEGTEGVKIGSLIAMTVDEGEDWQDVQIPAQTSTSGMATCHFSLQTLLVKMWLVGGITFSEHCASTNRERDLQTLILVTMASLCVQGREGDF